MARREVEYLRHENALTDAREQHAIESQRVAVVDVVVHHGRKEIVGRRDGVKIPGEMQVDLVHRDDLSVATTGCAALHPEDRS